MIAICKNVLNVVVPAFNCAPVTPIKLACVSIK